MREAVIVAGVRTAGGKAPRGTLRDTSPVFMGKLCIEEVIKRAGPSFNAEMIDDVIWGCATPEQYCGMNTARVTSLYAGIPHSVPAVTVNRFCSSGLQAISFGAEAIISNRCDVVLAGGIEHMSLITMGGVVRPRLGGRPEPRHRRCLHQHGADRRVCGIEIWHHQGGPGCLCRDQSPKMRCCHERREIQGRDRARSGQNNYPGSRWQAEDERDPLSTTKRVSGMMPAWKRWRSSQPAFVAGGTVTAANSSQTTDGASAVLLMSAEKAKELGIKPRLKYVGFAVAGCDPAIMGVGPVYAVPRLMKRIGMKVEDFGLIEINEAFASQALYCCRELGFNMDIVNVNGGAIAMGHPMGSTGSKLTVTMMHEMERRNVKYGLVTMCIGGGQGAAGAFELCS